MNASRFFPKQGAAGKRPSESHGGAVVTDDTVAASVRGEGPQVDRPILRVQPTRAVRLETERRGPQRRDVDPSQVLDVVVGEPPRPQEENPPVRSRARVSSARCSSGSSLS